MSSTYDEDLSTNSFLTQIINDHSDIIQNCISDGWILCIPRAGSLNNLTFSSDDLLSHVLVPDDELPKTRFFTLTEKSVNVSNKVISIDANDSDFPVQVHILFEETFYTDDNLKYKVWCIEEPLHQSYKSRNCVISSLTSLVTLRDCIDFLWTESAGRDVLETIDYHVKLFKNAFDSRDATLSISILRDKVSSLYTNCLQLAFKNKRLKERSKTCQNLMNNIKVAVETYVHHGIYKELIDAISVCTAYEDSSLNKIIRNLSDIQIKDLEINSKFSYCIPNAKQNLSRIQSFSTILGKVNCIKNTIDALNDIKKESSSENKIFLSTDELLPVIIFLVIKSGLPNWHAHLNFMKHFRFSVNYNLQLDETSYFISTLEAVIEHIKSGALFGSPLPESQWSDSSSTIDIEMTTYGHKSMFSKTTDIINHNDINEGSLEYVFKQIKLSNYDKVKELLQQSTDQIASEPNASVQKEILNHHTKKALSIEDILNEENVKLCHPLCTCSKCCHTFSKSMLQTAPSVFSCNNHGFTALHVACIYGKPQMVDLILELNAEINATDCNGSTPLHFAASRGHQNALLLLLHSGADINSSNMDKNTPLHMATNNGHDSCVKAMIYFAEYCKLKLNVSPINENGETPLHLASKWGYESIARLLLEYGADPWYCNKRGKSAIDFAHSGLMSRLLKSYSPNLNDFVNIVGIQKNVAEIIEVNDIESKLTLLDLNDDLDKNSDKTNLKIRPLSTKRIREVDRLFRAIAYGDVKLACFYMNIDIVSESSKSTYCEEKSAIEKNCHPLCVCPQCDSLNIDNNSFESIRKNFDFSACDLLGNTALHVAAEHGRIEICKILLNKGAQINLTNVNGLSPLHVAIKCNQFEMTSFFIESGANINLKDSMSNTPLHFACISGNAEIVKLILNTECALITSNSLGKTPLDEARDRLFLTIIGLLEPKT